MIVVFLKNIIPSNRYDLVYDFLLNFYYILLLLFTYHFHLKNKTKVNNDFLFVIKILNNKLEKEDFIYYVDKIKASYADFSKQNNGTKVAFILYLIFFVIQEFLTLGLIFYIASINDYIIECIFILTSFLISKQTYGAFHFKSFILCFFVSNVSFFILSKLTISVNITFVIPILFGITLSYIASLFIKKNDLLPYRGIPEEDLKKHCEEKELNKVETGVLVDYFANRYSLEKIARKHHYSGRHIQRIKAKALDKLAS